jgi:hypothetical protein
MEHQKLYIRLQHINGHPNNENVEQYHVFITKAEDKNSESQYEAEVNAVVPPVP